MFANYYGDHMVLQRAPAHANVWGYVDGCKEVQVTFNSTKIIATVKPEGIYTRICIYIYLYMNYCRQWYNVFMENNTTTN